MDNDQLREFGASIKQLVTALKERINASEQKHIDSYYNAGEYTLVVETLLFNAVHDKIELSAPEREQLLRFSRETNVQEEYLAPFLAMWPSDKH